MSEMLGTGTSFMCNHAKESTSRSHTHERKKHADMNIS